MVYLDVELVLHSPLNQTTTLHCLSAMANISNYWTAPKKDYQVSLKVIDEPEEPVIDFPLVLEPAKKEESLPNLLNQIAELAAKPSDIKGKSVLRQLLDNNGGAIHMKHLPLKSAEDFSVLLDSLAGAGENAWKPHVHIGMEVLRRPQAKNVLTANEYVGDDLPRCSSN